MTLRDVPATDHLLPISHFQKRMLFAAENPDTAPGFHEMMTNCWAFRVLPNLSPRVLRRSFNILVERHDSLRLKFVKTNIGWRAKILLEHPQGLQIVDLANHTATEQDTILAEYAAQIKTALSAPLFDVHILRCGPSGDLVLMRGHHSIIDGHGVALINEDILNSVLNLPLVGTPPGHRTAIQIYEKDLRANLVEKDTYWQTKLLPPPTDPVIGRNAKKLAPISQTIMGRTRRTGAIFSDIEAQNVDAKAKAYGVSIFSLLHAAFSETLCKASGQKEILVWSVIGRHDAKISTFVGTSIEPVLLRYTSNPAQLGERAAWVTREVAEASKYVPTEAFLPGNPIPVAFEKMDVPLKRFRVHISSPIGKMSDSPFRDFFNKHSQGKLSLGFLTIEQVALPARVETGYELDFVIEQVSNGTNAFLVANTEAYSQSELADLAKGIKAQLGLV